MRKIWQVIAVLVAGLCLGLAVVGCGSSTPDGKDKMANDKMGANKMAGDKMSGDKMGDKMSGDKMAGDKMKKE